MAKKVTCTLPNDGTINGIKFEADGDHVAAVVEDAVAAQFEGIPGYEVAEAEKAPVAPKKAAAKKEAEQTPPAGDGGAPAGDTPAA